MMARAPLEARATAVLNELLSDHPVLIGSSAFLNPENFSTATCQARDNSGQTALDTV